MTVNATKEVPDVAERQAICRLFRRSIEQLDTVDLELDSSLQMALMAAGGHPTPIFDGEVYERWIVIRDLLSAAMPHDPHARDALISSFWKAVERERAQAIRLASLLATGQVDSLYVVRDGLTRDSRTGLGYCRANEPRDGAS